MAGNNQCPVCRTENVTITNSLDGHFIDCPRCGEFINDGIKCEHDLPDYHKELCKEKNIDDNYIRSLLSHVLRKNYDENRRPLYTLYMDNIKTIIENNTLPTPIDQVEKVILYFGDNQKSLSKSIDFRGVYTRNPSNPCDNIEGETKKEFFARFGFLIQSDNEQFAELEYLLQQLSFDNILDNGNPFPYTSIHRLSIKGWKRYQELKRKRETSRFGFMAMRFPPNPVNPETSDEWSSFSEEKKSEQQEEYQKQLKEKDDFDNNTSKLGILHNKIYARLNSESFKENTGFQIINPLLSEPKAGNIIARMEVEIRNARFVIADLTHHNNGAYWEAGFAHGLGKPVFYLCADGVNPHFDVGSNYRVIWNPNKPWEAIGELKTLIRATLFGEAIMMDNEKFTTEIEEDGQTKKVAFDEQKGNWDDIRKNIPKETR